MALKNVQTKAALKDDIYYLEPLSVAEPNIAEVPVHRLEVLHVVQHGVGQGALLPAHTAHTLEYTQRRRN